MRHPLVSQCTAAMALAGPGSSPNWAVATGADTPPRRNTLESKIAILPASLAVACNRKMVARKHQSNAEGSFIKCEAGTAHCATNSAAARTVGAGSSRSAESHQEGPVWLELEAGHQGGLVMSTAHGGLGAVKCAMSTLAMCLPRCHVPEGKRENFSSKIIRVFSNASSSKFCYLQATEGQLVGAALFSPDSAVSAVGRRQIAPLSVPCQAGHLALVLVQHSGRWDLGFSVCARLQQAEQVPAAHAACNARSGDNGALGRGRKERGGIAGLARDAQAGCLSH